ncbi:glycosyltransferase family 1 protein [Chitinophaga sp. OAE865]|uniref:glycosyltransferase family 4 protein n=1 Tax=Chitinophaga sp. OAE865 TaxID=2817898 RepID=UPI001AE507CA
MKRIAFISEHASPLAILGGVDAGGQNVYVAELARQLTQKGYAVDIFTRRENRDYPRCLQWRQGIRIIHVDAGPPEVIEKEKLLPYMAAFREDMLKFIKEERMDYLLIHANFFMSALVAMELKCLLHIPYVITFHALGHIRQLYQGENDRFPPERLVIEEQAMMMADGIVAECPQDREDLLKYYDAPADRIAVIPCGVNLDELFPIDKQLARIMLRLPKEEKILLQLGRIVPRKGIDNVIQALSKLSCRRHQNVRLIVVGGDANPTQHNHEAQRLKMLAKELGVTAGIQFAGHKNRDELKYYYSAADLFITTPWYEPFGITPLESMACGTPVIGANVGGIKYSVADGVTGKLVPPRDPDALATAISELLHAPGRLNEMGEQAVRRVRKLFTWQQVASRMHKLYSEVLARSAGRSEAAAIKRAV